MMEYAKKIIGGTYRAVSDEYDAEYVIVPIDEYYNLQTERNSAVKRASVMKQKYEKELPLEISKVENNYKYINLELKEKNQSLQEQMEEMKKEVSKLVARVENVHDLESDLANERAWRKNLQRIATERANQQRGIPNKKAHDGYIVLSSQQYEEKWTEEIDLKTWRKENPMKDTREYSRRKYYSASVWKSIIQTPHDASIPFGVIEDDIYQALWENGILVELGCMSCLEKEDKGEHFAFEDKENVMYNWSYAANYKSGFWEITIYTTKALDVPEHRRPQKTPTKAKTKA